MRKRELLKPVPIFLIALMLLGTRSDPAPTASVTPLASREATNEDSLSLSVESRIRVDAEVPSLGETESILFWIWDLPDSVLFEEGGSRVFIEHATPAGDYRAKVRCAIVDWDARTSRSLFGYVDFEVAGSSPTPEPNPDPGPTPTPIPPDEFGNIGQAVAMWAREFNLEKTTEAARNYEEAASRLLGEKSPPLLEIEDATDFLSRANEPLELSQAWTEFGLKVNDRWQVSGVSDRFEAGRFFRAVSRGLEGAQ